MSMFKNVINEEQKKKKEKNRIPAGRYTRVVYVYVGNTVILHLIDDPFLAKENYSLITAIDGRKTKQKRCFVGIFSVQTRCR